MHKPEATISAEKGWPFSKKYINFISIFIFVFQRKNQCYGISPLWTVLKEEFMQTHIKCFKSFNRDV